MAGTFRVYDEYYVGLLRGRFTTQTDTYKLALVTSAYVPNPVATDRVSGTTYAVGDVFYSPTFLVYYCAVTAGTAGTGTPAFSGVLGSLTTDGTVVWECVGLSPPSTHTCLLYTSPSPRDA